ncbi:type 1 glutamine amidotransferase [Mameliella alba]|nr:type 1 glutamine amidotransferase [Antarctobacter heliothermus]MBY6143604.1 type 1 glutamine amidotransferase [Mameliella alba]MCA0952672.1 type 1 glutamine amidotransferase [Mameliella alba]
MSRLLILNGNPLEVIAAGSPDYAQVFSQVFRALDPSVDLDVLNPNHEPLTDDALEFVDGVVFTGSSTVYAADAPEAEPHRRAMEQVFALGLPVWGSCNGMQLAGVVLGGKVGASPKGVEIGLGRALTLTEAGQGHPMMAGRKPVFTACTIHRDEVQALPADAVLLATNDHSPVQAFTVSKGGVDFWGTQYHPEIAPPLIANALRRRDGDAQLAEDMDNAETDPEAAARLGAAPGDLDLPVRAMELCNWLAHVRARKSGAQAA